MNFWEFFVLSLNVEIPWRAGFLKIKDLDFTNVKTFWQGAGYRLSKVEILTVEHGPGYKAN